MECLKGALIGILPAAGGNHETVPVIAATYSIILCTAYAQAPTGEVTIDISNLANLLWTLELSSGANRLPAANPDGRPGGRIRGTLARANHEPIRVSTRLRKQSELALARFFEERFRELGIGLEIPDLAEGNFRNLTLTAQFNVSSR